MSKFTKFSKAALRVTAVLAVLALLLGYLDLRVAEAAVMDRLLGLGSRMAPYLDDGRATEAPRQVRVNGLSMFVAAGQTSHPTAFVRRWYQDRYAQKGDGLDTITEDLKRRGALPPSVTGLNQMVFGDEQKGGVAALDFGEKLSLEALKTRLLRFVGKGELGQIGRLRYVYYEKTGAGGTRFLTVWSDEKFTLDQLMPKEKRDAAGSDLPGVPRFPGSIRILSAEERGMPQRLAVYEGVGSPDTATLFYKARMETLGWAEDHEFARLAQRQGKRALKFDNVAGREVMLDLSDAPQAGVTIVAMLK